MYQIKTKWSKVPKWGKIILYVILGIIGFTLVGGVSGFGIKLLWNWLMPELFNLNEITYWQAIGIFVFAKIIFGFGGSSEQKTEKKDKVICGGNKQESMSWRYYDEWWESEGKHGFEDFIEKRNENYTKNKV
jgi:hypothetical protein